MQHCAFLTLCLSNTAYAALCLYNTVAFITMWLCNTAALPSHALILQGRWPEGVRHSVEVAEGVGLLVDEVLDHVTLELVLAGGGLGEDDLGQGRRNMTSQEQIRTIVRVQILSKSQDP